MEEWAQLAKLTGSPVVLFFLWVISNQVRNQGEFTAWQIARIRRRLDHVENAVGSAAKIDPDDKPPAPGYTLFPPLAGRK